MVKTTCQTAYVHNPLCNRILKKKLKSTGRRFQILLSTQGPITP